MKLPIFVALDVDDPKEARGVVDRLFDHVQGFKVGPRLLLRAGPDWAREIAKKSELFIDFKFHDIPSTTVAAVETAFELGASVCTVHAANNRAALEALGDLQEKLQRERAFRILGVTVLTSISEDDRPTIWAKEPLENLVQKCVLDLREAGLAGLVCSPFEVKLAKKTWPEGFILTPGIRSASDEKQDQVRTMTAAEALKLGASALVLGRSLLHNKNPELVLTEIRNAMLEVNQT